MTTHQYEVYKGLEMLRAEVNSFKPNQRFTGQTDRWGASKVGRRFITDLNTLIADVLLAIDKEQKEL